MGLIYHNLGGGQGARPAAEFENRLQGGRGSSASIIEAMRGYPRRFGVKRAVW